MKVTGFLAFPEFKCLTADTLVDDCERHCLLCKGDVFGRLIEAVDDEGTGGTEGGFGFHMGDGCRYDNGEQSDYVKPIAENK